MTQDAAGAAARPERLVPGPVPRIVGPDASQRMTAFVACWLGLGRREGAYMAASVRAGLSAVDGGQTGAAQARAMRGGRLPRRVVPPQAMRVTIPPPGNEFITML